MNIRIARLAALLAVCITLVLGVTAPRSVYADGDCTDPNTTQEECVIDPGTNPGLSVQIAPFPPGQQRPGGRLSISMNPNQSVYYIGMQVTICYAVPWPGSVQILDYTVSGINVIYTSYDGGTCLYNMWVTPPSGPECLRLVWQPFPGSQRFYAGKCFFTSF